MKESPLNYRANKYKRTQTPPTSKRTTFGGFREPIVQVGGLLFGVVGFKSGIFRITLIGLERRWEKGIGLGRRG